MKPIHHPAWLEVDLDKVARNIRKLKAEAGEGVKLLAMVKAQGYGCGAEMVSRAALESGAELVGVANVGEGAALRASGLDCPILIFGRPGEAELETVVEDRLHQTVFELGLARQLDAVARRSGKKVKVHLKVDTGMGRVGLLPGEVEEFLGGLAGLPGLDLEGVYTHFSAADADKQFTEEQVRIFREVLNKIRESGFSIPLAHIANTAALLNRCCELFDMVRPGISIYGLYGSPMVSRELNLEEVMSFKARVIHVKRVPCGASVSYGREFRAARETTIVTIAAGYADGVPFRLAREGDVLIHGRRFPIAGRVTMDMTMVDAGDFQEVQVGDEAVIIGRSGQESISVTEVARKTGTIEHEVICGIGPRVPRVYLRGGQIGCVQGYAFGEVQEAGTPMEPFA